MSIKFYSTMRWKIFIFFEKLELAYTEFKCNIFSH